MFAASCDVVAASSLRLASRDSPLSGYTGYLLLFRPHLPASPPSGLSPRTTVGPYHGGCGGGARSAEGGRGSTKSVSNCHGIWLRWRWMLLPDELLLSPLLLATLPSSFGAACLSDAITFPSHRATILRRRGTDGVGAAAASGATSFRTPHEPEVEKAAREIPWEAVSFAHLESDVRPLCPPVCAIRFTSFSTHHQLIASSFPSLAPHIHRRHPALFATSRTTVAASQLRIASHTSPLPGCTGHLLLL